MKCKTCGGNHRVLGSSGFVEHRSKDSGRIYRRDLFCGITEEIDIKTKEPIKMVAVQEALKFTEQPFVIDTGERPVQSVRYRTKPTPIITNTTSEPDQ